MAVESYLARIRALERVQAVLQANLAAALADADIAEVTGLPLPAPPAEGYHLLTTAEQARERIMTEAVAVYLWQAEKSASISESADTTTTLNGEDHTFISVMVVCRQANADTITHVGQSMSQWSQMTQRLHRYRAALERVVRGYACGGAGIFKVRVADDWPPQAIRNDAGQLTRGYVTVKFQFTQHVTRITSL